MLNFNEDLLHFIWRHRLLKPVQMKATDGRDILILKPGLQNADAGPDFFNALVTIGGVTLAGNIEIHIRTSDWLRHNHQADRNYDRIILHVVFRDDLDLVQNKKYNVAILEIADLIDERIISTYGKIASTRQALPCHAQLKWAGDHHFVIWLERMLGERLEEKSGQVESLFKSNADYLQTFYALLLRNFGFKLNAIPFEVLARQLPLNILLKHADNLMQLEALLLGMAGFLRDAFKHPYLLKLQVEFAFLKSKYGLAPLENSIFKFSKLRPANFPNVRLAQLATLIHRNSVLFTSPQLLFSYPDIMKAMLHTPDGYWASHYVADAGNIERSLRMGIASIENVMINTFAPFFYFYGRKLSKPVYIKYAIGLLRECNAEDNFKTRLYAAKKHLIKTGAGSQALLNLYDHYCVQKKCLKCGVAASFLNPGMVEEVEMVAW
jgi:hypothetical protein